MDKNGQPKVKGTVKGRNRGEKHSMELFLLLWADYIKEEFDIVPNQAHFHLLPQCFIGDKELLNKGETSGYDFSLGTGALKKNHEWEEKHPSHTYDHADTSLSLLPDKAKFSYFVKGILNNTIDLDSTVPNMKSWRNHMHQPMKEYDDLMYIKRSAQTLPKSLVPTREPKTDKASKKATKEGTEKKTRKKKKDEEKKEESEKEKSEGDGGGGDDVSSDEDEESTGPLPGKSEFLKLCRGMVSEEIRDQVDFNEIQIALEFAMSKELIKSIQFDNDELGKLFEDNQLRGSGYFLTCRDKVLRDQGEQYLKIAQEKVEGGLKRYAEKNAGPKPKKNRKTGTSPDGRKEDKSKVRDTILKLGFKITRVEI